MLEIPFQLPAASVYLSGQIKTHGVYYYKVLEMKVKMALKGRSYTRVYGRTVCT